MIRAILTMFMRLFSLALVGAFIWFVGWKGVIAFVIGMGIMAYLILSENPLLLIALDFARGKRRCERLEAKEMIKANKILKP